MKNHDNIPGTENWNAEDWNRFYNYQVFSEEKYAKHAPFRALRVLFAIGAFVGIIFIPNTLGLGIGLFLCSLLLIGSTINHVRLEHGVESETRQAIGWFLQMFGILLVLGGIRFWKYIGVGLVGGIIAFIIGKLVHGQRNCIP
jgi:hypothetical protein